ncbi:MAG: NTP transferase domain-containing protein [Oscillospiraceae bacterium]|jgi:glucose-1-phosphate cytidylyltransferase|nr:NTP transferase domain-containing protein [Oscillospiraceae bacterium]
MEQLVILAGGLPSSINDDPQQIPKPMIDIGGRPLLWHIMKYYSQFGIRDFIICAGYKSDVIKQYFLNYYIYRSDITIDLSKNKVELHNKITEPWYVTVLDTGIHATTASRIKQVEDYVENDVFLITYGDCLSNISVIDLKNLFKSSHKTMTVAAAAPTGRNKVLNISSSGNICVEKNQADSTTSWTNACTMAADHRIFHYLNHDDIFETETIQKLAAVHETNVFYHHGFWCPVETVRDKNYVETLWNHKKAPWKIWND